MQKRQGGTINKKISSDIKNRIPQKKKKKVRGERIMIAILTSALYKCSLFLVHKKKM